MPVLKTRPRVYVRQLAVAVCLLLIASPALRAQFQAATSSDRPVSPTVLASWYTRNSRLTLLVLFRGSPGWFWRVNGGSGGGGGNGQEAFQEIHSGGLTFRIDYNFITNTAKVAGTTLSLTETNVVMVDFVDSVGGPTVVDRRYVDPLLTDPLRDAGLTVVGREPDLYRFLQCDLSLPPSSEPIAQLQQSLISMICAQLRPQ